MKINALTLATLVAGIAAAYIQFAYLHGLDARFRADVGIAAGVVVGSLWLVLTFLSLLRHGWRAAWTLIVAPFALVGPYLAFLLIFFCGNCI